MVDLIRSQYGYLDEYILSKTLSWLKESVRYISRRKYEDMSMSAQLIALSVSNLFAEKGKAKPIPTYDEFITGKPREEIDENFMADSLNFLSKKIKKK